MILDIIIFAAAAAIFGFIVKDLFFKKEKSHTPIVPIIPIASTPVVPPSEGLASIMALEAPTEVPEEKTPETKKTVKPKRKYGGKVKKNTNA